MQIHDEKLIGNRYRIIKKLAQGGFGKTYLAEDTFSSNSLCAIKKLNPQTADLEAAKRLFQREANILNYLKKNRQIPQYLNYFEEGENYYLVEEYIKGEPLNCLLDKPWSKREVINFLKQLLSILKFLHLQKIVHRDINPSNIIRKVDRKFVLIDFGSVKQLNSSFFSPQAQLPQTIIATPGYAPPEQMLGRPKLNSDIYALGMTAIQLLTGIHPSSLKRDAQDNIVWNHTIDADDSLAAIITKMVCLNSERRYQSTDEVINDLNKTELSINLQQITEKIEAKGKRILLRSLPLKQIAIGLIGLSSLLVVLESIHPFLRPLYYSYRGNSLLDARLPKAALEQFQNIIEIQPQSAEAWQGRGNALFSLGYYPGAIESYNKALQYQPNNLKVLNNKARILYKQRKYQDALDTSEQALKIDTNNAEAWSGKGLAYIGLRQYQKASESFEKAQKIKPDEPTVWLEEGLAIEPLAPKLARESYLEALRCYDDLLKKQSNALLWTDRGLVLLKLNRPQAALNSYRKALDFDKNFYEALLGKGNVLSILGQNKEALSAFEQAKQIRPEDYQVWYNRGMLLLQDPQAQQEALKSFETAIELREDFSPAWLGKGLALIELHRNQEALSALDTAKNFEPQNPYIWANRGYVLEQLQRNSEAKIAYNEARKLGWSPNN